MGRNPDPAYKVERSCFHSSAANLDDILLNDQIINILLFEEPENMLQSLEE